MFVRTWLRLIFNKNEMIAQYSNTSGAGLEILNALKLERDNIAKSIIALEVSDIPKVRAELKATNEKYQNCVSQSSTAKQKGCCADIWIYGKQSSCIGQLYQTKPLPSKDSTSLANKLNNDLLPRLAKLKTDLAAKQKQIEDTEAVYNTGTGTGSNNPAIDSELGRLLGGISGVSSGLKSLSPTAKYVIVGVVLTGVGFGIYKLVTK